MPNIGANIAKGSVELSRSLTSSLVCREASLPLALPRPDARADLLVEVEPVGAHLHGADPVEARVELVALAGRGAGVDTVLAWAERVAGLGPLQRVPPPALVLRVLERWTMDGTGSFQSLCCCHGDREDYRAPLKGGPQVARHFCLALPGCCLA